MGKTKAAHHRGTYHVRSRAVVAAAYADPTTTCWRCGRTLGHHRRTVSGNPPRWSAGHIIDGEVDGLLLPEVLSCNSAAGGRLRGRRRPQPPLYVAGLSEAG